MDNKSKLSRTEQLTAEKTVCVLLVRGESEDGEQMFAYVGVRADKLEEFMEAQRSGMFYPEDYGVVIEAGEGEPSDEVRHKMETEYGFNHDSMMDIPDPDKAVEITKTIDQSIREAKQEEQ